MTAELAVRTLKQGAPPWPLTGKASVICDKFGADCLDDLMRVMRVLIDVLDGPLTNPHTAFYRKRSCLET